MSGIDIQGIAGAGAELAFGLVDGCLTDAVLHIFPGEGTVPDYEGETDGTTSYNVRGLLYQSASQKLADDSAFTNTFALRLAALTQAGLTEAPAVDDYLIIASARWNVTRVEPDPAQALYLIRLRRA